MVVDDDRQRWVIFVPTVETSSITSTAIRPPFPNILTLQIHYVSINSIITHNTLTMGRCALNNIKFIDSSIIAGCVKGHPNQQHLKRATSPCAFSLLSASSKLIHSIVNSSVARPQRALLLGCPIVGLTLRSNPCRRCVLLCVRCRRGRRRR